MDEEEVCGVCDGGHDPERHDRRLDEAIDHLTRIAPTVVEEQQRMLIDAQMFGASERLLKARAFLAIADAAPNHVLSDEGIRQMEEWFLSSYVDGLALLGFTVEDRHTLVWTTRVTRDGPDLSAITRDIARGG